MTRKGPLVTLLGGGALAIVLLVLSTNAASQDAASREAAQTAGNAVAESTPAATEEPSAAEEEVPAEEEPAEDAPVTTYVGWVDGGGVSVAIAVQGEEAIAYICDGYQLEAWLEGTASDGELSLRGEQGEELGGSYDNYEATGSVSDGEQNWTFQSEYAAAPDGLYRFAETVDGAEVVAGWIELRNGEQIGAVRINGVAGPVAPLDVDTMRSEINGEPVTATVATP